ncbi:MAG: rRNA pseudouridine synthase [Dysgonamonadaceae bacterium]|jgi:23S rRNA pseudouridine2605 synthase|nr:rRNA pseudouridine synthase [Dysgonamonadaceae bacterium]
MIADKEEWKTRNFSERRDDRVSHERRYSHSNEDSYGNNEDKPYNYPNYNQGGNYERRQNSGNYQQRQGGYYPRQGGGGNHYERRDNGYNQNRPKQYNNPRYDNNTYNSPSGDASAVKKRRPRVGESNMQPQRGGNNYGSYNRQGQGQNYNYNSGGRKPQGGGYVRNNRPQQNNQQGGRPQVRKQQTPYNPNAKFGLQKQLKYREEHFDPNELLRLNKYLANAGVCSRREADEFIQAGLVKVNDVIVTELGTKIKRMDKVMFHDQPIQLEPKIYVLLNKPKNCVTTVDDMYERLTVMDLVKNACRERIFPVGRLDRNTTGVLLLTNDGDLASKLTHPKFLKKKIYHVWLDKEVLIEDMQKIAEGIELEDGEIHADAISYVMETDKTQVGIEIHSGRNRIVRRMFESIGYHVVKLDRVYFAGLTKKNLKRGQWRYLNEREVNMLRTSSFE